MSKSTISVGALGPSQSKSYSIRLFVSNAETVCSDVKITNP